jgi:carboxypeptidase PM20D1
MIKKLFGFLGIALLVLIAVVLFNTFITKPWPVVASATLTPLPDSAVQHLSEAVQIPTVSLNDTAPLDTVDLQKFGAFVQTAYPLVNTRLEKTMINKYAFVFKWAGQDTALPPIILMGHYDVVPVEAAVLNKWQAPPFSGLVTDSCVWGRGSVDDKASVISVLEATEGLLRKGFVPKRTIYLCFGYDEETNGNGANAIVEYLRQKKVHAELVLDEGGEITEEEGSIVNRPIAVVGVAEKGYSSYELSVEKEGGHSSKPAKETAIDILVTALYKLRSKTPPAKLTPPVSEFIHRVGSSSTSFAFRMASANMWLFSGIVEGALGAKPEGSAMMHTTIVPTIIQTGVKDNVIPSTATAIVNSRILTGETVASVQEYIKNAIQDDRIKIKRISRFGGDPSMATGVESPAYKRIESAIYKTVPNVIPTPYLMIGATDSRAYRSISDGVLNFLPMTDGKGYHGINERLPILDLQRGINFMTSVIEGSGKEF